jgi:ADP-ribosylglycohydrolase
MDNCNCTRRPYPIYKNIHNWEKYHTQLLIEYRQSIEEGKDLKGYKDLFAAVHEMPECREKINIADSLYNIVFEAPVIEDYKYIEPSDIENIKKSSDGGKLPKKSFTKQELYNKVKGAWIGRICGCLLGKPFEGIMQADMINYMKKANNYPFHRYALQKEITEDIINSSEFKFPTKTFPDVIKNAPIDDDTNYTVMSSNIIEEYGKDFNSENVARTWIFSQLKDDYCTAERVAYLNAVNGYCPPDTAIYKNPYREWIGAQIRGDYFGYINPCDIQTAAEMAWRDARISHIKNGIYGEMFIAAMLAAAFSLDDIKEIIKAGLSTIPNKSRLYESITKLMAYYDSGNSFEDFLADFHKRYNERDCHDWCLTVSNAEIVVAALLYSENDYGKAICLAVQSGLDTDCNGATVGSVMGLKNGFDDIDEVWHKPLNGELDTTILFMRKVKIEDMVLRTIKHIESYAQNVSIK